MCQLTYINCDDTQLQKTILYLLLYNNSSLNNKDGFGFFIQGTNTIIRSPNDFTNSNIRSSLHSITTKNPIMAHVRSAFSGIGGKQLGIEFNHPFDGNFFILEHNGVLQYKDTEREVPKDKIDSQIFLQELDKAYEMDTDVIRALQTTMELFTGKFAFIIFNKSSNKYYAVRGKTADLHSQT